MRKIYWSILMISAALALVGSATYALFSDQAVSGPNVFATGNADLQISIDTDKDGTRSEWADEVHPWDQYMENNWRQLYPGWEDSYHLWLKNNSSAPIDLRVIPTIGNVVTNKWALLDNIELQFFYLDGTPASDKRSLREWQSNTDPLIVITQDNPERGPWVVKFSIPAEAGNNIKDSEISFDLIFNGEQVMP